MLRNYLLLAWKVLLRRKFFTFISLVGISLTLATILVVTAIIDYHANPPRPYTKQARMLFVKSVMGKSKNFTTVNEAHYGFHDKYVRSLPSVDKFSIQTESTFITYPNGQKTTLTAKIVDGAFWDMFDFEFLEGAPFTEDDNQQRRMVAVVSEKTRQRYFGDAPALGKSITLGSKTYRIVGVARDVASSLSVSGDVWYPVSIDLTPKDRTGVLDEGAGGFTSVILANNASDLPSIQAAFQAMLPTVKFASSHIQYMQAAAETNFGVQAQMFFGFDSEDKEYGKRDNATRLIALLMALALGFMALPAINLVNVNVSRILERASEIGVRKAFGASGTALVGQFIVENLVLTIIGGAIGVLFAELVLVWITSAGIFPNAVFHVNARVALYALGMSAVFGLLSGVLPAWKMARLPIVQSLKGGINA